MIQLNQILRKPRSEIINMSIDAYIVDSEVVKGVTYIARDNDFAMIQYWSGHRCSIDELPEFIKLCLDPELKAELMEIASDLFEFKHGGRIYGWC